MAHGPLPKPADQRARRNKDVIQGRVVPLVRADQPPLPEFSDGWPLETVKWWEMWSRSPLAADFTEAEWCELKIAAVLHAKFWLGDLKVATELRLRTEKFGVTPADRARLRITFAQADEAEAKRPVSPVDYSDLRVTRAVAGG